MPKNSNKNISPINPQPFDGNKIPPQLDGHKESQPLNNYIEHHITNLSKNNKSPKP